MYKLEEHIKDYLSGKKIKYLFFWGHRARKDGCINSSCFSQWWPSEFNDENYSYCSAEHYMMAQKAKLFGDEKMYLKILNTSSPAQAKQYGRQVKGFDDIIWNKHKFQIVVEANRLKFSQNPDLKHFLLNTKTRVIVEASPVDKIWGIGLTADSEQANNPTQWRGENLLGFALMEVRNILMENEQAK